MWWSRKVTWRRCLWNQVPRLIRQRGQTVPSGGSRGLPIKGQAWPGTHLISARDSLGACIPESQACFLHGILSRPEESLGPGTVPHTSSISSKKKKKKKSDQLARRRTRGQGILHRSQHSRRSLAVTVDSRGKLVGFLWPITFKKRALVPGTGACFPGREEAWRRPPEYLRGCQGEEDALALGGLEEGIQEE